MAPNGGKKQPQSRRPFQGTRRSYVEQQYPAYVRNNRLRASDIRCMRNEARSFDYRPLISVVVPVYNPEQKWLELALDSVMSQIYPHWELCVCDDGSTREHVREVLSRYGRLDERVKVKLLENNTGISEASNAALSLATGEFVGLLDHDDELTPDALFEVVKLLQEHPEADIIYTDEDKIDESGSRRDPQFKPQWSPDLLLSYNYITHLLVFRMLLLEKVGSFRRGFEGSQDYDLVLRLTEQTTSIHHVPKVLYHWKTGSASVAAGAKNKTYAHERDRRALEETLERRGIKGSVEDGAFQNCFRVSREVEGMPMVSIIIPTRDNLSMLRTCVESIERLTAYRNYEIIIVDNDSTDPETLDYLGSIPHRVIKFEGTFNHSAINNLAVSRAEGNYILFLNNDTEVISSEWLEAMLQHAQRPKVGAVGAKLLFPDGAIQHAGVITGAGTAFGVGNVATHAYHSYDARSNRGILNVTKNYSGVTAACMMMRRTLFEEIGGFDERYLPTIYNDVDLCMRIRDRGYLIVYTPYAELYHHERASRPRGIDLAVQILMRGRWGKELDEDPYYNPNFSRGHGDFNLRADMLRPRALRANDEETDNTLQGAFEIAAEEMSQEELRSYITTQRSNARSSPRTGLVPLQRQQTQSQTSPSTKTPEDRSPNDRRAAAVVQPSWREDRW
jgi:O-antigen biosynthesis protein